MNQKQSSTNSSQSQNNNQTIFKPLGDVTLENISGGGSHEKWIPIESMSQSVSRQLSATDENHAEAVPMEDFSLNFEEIKVSY